MTGISRLVANKKVAIWGFGMEGQSTYRFLRTIDPTLHLGIFDIEEEIAKHPLLTTDEYIDVNVGKNYLSCLNDYDIAIKSPGISLKKFDTHNFSVVISSQTDLFLAAFASQTIGITATKGKSTTASLLYHILKGSGREVILAGNIGLPLFEIIEQMTPQTLVVFEMSSHQLENVGHSPHIAAILNIFEEHLDHYRSFQDYQKAKLNISAFQKSGDYVVYNKDNTLVANGIGSFTGGALRIPYSLLKKNLSTGIFVDSEDIICQLPNKQSYTLSRKLNSTLKGQHNFSNILSVIGICGILEIPIESIVSGLGSFEPLPHRLEYIGFLNGKHFYNDSIATIPEATIEAIKTIENIETVIIGGYDRGIDYSSFVDFLENSEVKNFIFIGIAGQRILNQMKDTPTKNKYYFNCFYAACEKAVVATSYDKACLLSPAAASYDMFKDFSERGNLYKTLVKKFSSML